MSQTGYKAFKVVFEAEENVMKAVFFNCHGIFQHAWLKIFLFGALQVPINAEVGSELPQWWGMFHTCVCVFVCVCVCVCV